MHMVLLRNAWWVTQKTLTHPTSWARRSARARGFHEAPRRSARIGGVAGQAGPPARRQHRRRVPVSALDPIPQSVRRRAWSAARSTRDVELIQIVAGYGSELTTGKG